jgi:GntR family transcriptional repressor for pyruvate dehydrogenase complex
MGHSLLSDPVGFRVADAEFHELISEAARNDFLRRVSQSLYGLAIDQRRRASIMPGVLHQSAADHRAIMEAIVAGDGEAASAAMGRHVEHIRITTEQARQAHRASDAGVDDAG